MRRHQMTSCRVDWWERTMKRRRSSSMEQTCICFTSTAKRTEPISLLTPSTTPATGARLLLTHVSSHSAYIHIQIVHVWNFNVHVCYKGYFLYVTYKLHIHWLDFQPSPKDDHLWRCASRRRLQTTSGGLPGWSWRHTRPIRHAGSSSILHSQHLS